LARLAWQGCFAVALVPPPPLLAPERAALARLLTPIAVDSALDLDPDVAFLCKTEFDAGQGGERGDASREPLDRGSPVRLRGDLPRPVIEAAVVHAVSSLSSL
jgi:hypothetical protein